MLLLKLRTRNRVPDEMRARCPSLIFPFPFNVSPALSTLLFFLANSSRKFWPPSSVAGAPKSRGSGDGAAAMNRVPDEMRSFIFLSLSNQLVFIANFDWPLSSVAGAPKSSGSGNGAAAISKSGQSATGRVLFT
eukprot:CAMPEP_0173061490 /NCGR_PEP_ID=MMETSP1102-20130122/3247_1 /TAXON_ID=49646 /ORGANISM="Geminigera sp., Strain Caron Lab Isolate" /LENGTH=133 /DNA_ID=CAMNT_0013927967 /DNA_START=653 /DNA_END=1054 /DNA_ORIENTATION=-